MDQHPNQIAGVIATDKGRFSAAVGTDPEASNRIDVPVELTELSINVAARPKAKHPLAVPVAPLKYPALTAGSALPVMFLIRLLPYEVWND